LVAFAGPGVVGCGRLGGSRPGVLCATRVRLICAGSGLASPVPQDHGSSWGAAV
jgi:hypothetical protein